MIQFDGFIGLLDSRSFGTIWYWLVFAGLWIWSGQNVIGVPNDVISQVGQESRRTEGASEKFLALLDWLSLSLPRWQISHREAVAFLAVAAFLVTSLAILGFVYDLEMAQALIFLLVPYFIILWLRLQLARGLMELLEAARNDKSNVTVSARDAGARIIRHKRLILTLAALSSVITSYWALRWTLLHPNGM